MMPHVETQPDIGSVAASPVEREYRALSVLGMLSLLLGIASVVALAHPLLAIVAIAAIAISGMSLRHISANSDRLSGKWMAICGMSLAALFLGWAISRELSREAVVRKEARQFSDEFLQILTRKESFRAHQLCLDHSRRFDPHLDVENFYRHDAAVQKPHDDFVLASPVKELLAASPAVTCGFEEVTNYKREGFNDVVTLQYYYEAPKFPQRRFWITVQRKYSPFTGRSDWQVSTVANNAPYRN